MSAGNSVYSPLPQSNSDSDEFSEEELHSSNESERVINRMTKLPKQTKPEVLSSDKNQRITNYKQLDDDRDIGIALNGFQLGSEEITVLKPNNKIEKFSISRKICFVFSILLCISTTIVFLWILPCEIGPCPSVPIEVTTNSWKKLLSGIELHGPISVVPSVSGGNQNLMFLYRKSLKEGNETQNTVQGGGIIHLLGSSGEVSWCTILERDPKDIDCNIIDVDLDGSKDCLIVGKVNLLQAIHSLSGHELWTVDGNKEFDSKSCDFSFPVALPDINGDRVSDLLTICADSTRRKDGFDAGPKNSFILISGANGTTIGNPMEISNCYSISNFMVEKENLISYTCLDPKNQESLKTVPLLQIILKSEPTLSTIRLNQTDLKAQHKIRDDENIFYVQGRRLNLENQGRCPDDCSMLVTVKDERNGKKNQTLWTMKSNRSYGMIPVIMKFRNFNGFVLKYWHWEPNKKKELSRETSLGSSSMSDTNKKMKRLENSKFLEMELLQGKQQESVRQKRMLVKRQLDKLKKLEWSIFNEENHIFHKIIEKVVLIVFNETDSHSVNASQSEITQICKKKGDCQPDVLLQRHSLHITDLDGDKFQELISYSSSFVNSIESKLNSKYIRWQLQSTVRVIRLEAELPKLYDGKNQ